MKTVAQTGTIMNFTTPSSAYTSGRTPWPDLGWPACDERLVTVTEAHVHGVGANSVQLPDVR
jgi:hypothetical protein